MIKLKEVKKNILEKSWLNLMAWLVFITVTVNLVAHLYIWHGYWWEIFWFCDFVAISLVIGIWTRNKDLVTAVLISSIPLQFWWILDFFLELSGHGIGRTAWLFAESKGWFISGLSTILHGIIIPTSWLWMRRLGFGKKSMIYAFFVGMFMLGGTYIFTRESENINCIFFPCDITYPVAYQDSIHNYFSIQYAITEFWKSILITGIVYLVFLWFYRKRG